MNKAIFFDKDGTLIPDAPYNVDPTRITLTQGVGEALARFKKKGYKLIVVSNQSGVAHGYFEEEALKAVYEKLQSELRGYEVQLDGFYYCPHHPKGKISKYKFACDCRKPNMGMLKKAQTDWEIDLEKSWMVGDILNDIEAGNKAQCNTILFAGKSQGGETQWIINKERLPDFIAYNFNDIAHIIEQYDNTNIS